MPYSPVSTETPDNSRLPGVQVSTPAAAFGESVGQATAGFGAQLEKSGDEIFKRALAIKQLANEAEAKEADAKYIIEAGRLHADYNSLQGKQAVDGFPQYMGDLKKLRDDIRGGLSNDYSRKLYDGPSLSVMSRTIFNGAGHAASQNKRYVAGASQARIDAIVDGTLHDPDNDISFVRGRSEIEGEIRNTQSAIGGWSPELTEQKVRNEVSKLASARIVGMARVKPFTAKDLLEEHRGTLTAGDLDRTEKIVQNQLRITGSRIIDERVNRDLKQDPMGERRPLQERIDEAVAQAKREAPEDTTFHDMTRQRIIATYNQSRAVKRDYDIDNINIINGALTKPNQARALPTTVEELTSNPAVRSAWESLDETKQRSFMSALAKNAKGPVIPWNNDRLRRYRQLKGLAQENPLEFMGTDVVNEDLPNDAKKTLVDLQIAKKAKSESDPRVTHALQVLRPMMQSAGLDSSRDKDQYYQFVGALQDALDVQQKDTKKLPNKEEIEKIGARLLQQQGSKEFMLPWSKDFRFALPVPEAEANRIKLDPKWNEIGVVPTDQMVQRIYTREQYQKLYGKSPTKSENKPSVPVR